MIKLSWTEFHSLIESRKLSIPFIEYSDKYRLFVSIEGVNFTCDIFRDGNADVIEFETGHKVIGNKDNGIRINPFSSKLMEGKKLFKRVHGIQQICTIGVNTFEFIIPNGNYKMKSVEVIGGVACDKVDFKVYDTPTGVISTYPNAMLSQFGFSANIADGFYSQVSEFDTDLFKDMKIIVTYTAIIEKLIGINFILNELK